MNMFKIISFSALKNWLGSTEMFTRPSKKLPGKWDLFEFYFEPDKELIHVEENQIKAEKLYYEIHFAENEAYFQNTNLAVPLIEKMKNGKWNISRNFVSIINAEDFRNNVEFQFAVEKEVLKLLRKNALGKIEFFGFFRRTIVK